MVIDFQTKEELKNLFNERMVKKSKKAIILSANKLDDADKTRLNEKFVGLGNEDVRVEYHIDETLLAGVVIKMGSSIIDLSLKGQLLQLRQKMYENS